MLNCEFFFSPSLVCATVKKNSHRRGCTSEPTGHSPELARRDDDVTPGRLCQHGGQTRRPNMSAFTVCFPSEGQIFTAATPPVKTVLRTFVFFLSSTAKTMRVVDLRRRHVANGLHKAAGTLEVAG